MIKLESVGVSTNQPENKEPILAPALKAGANIPPAAPTVNERTEPIIRNKGVYQGKILFSVNKVVVMIDFPEPKIFSFIKNAMATRIKAQTIEYVMK